MPGGLLTLVFYGNENIITNGNPQTSWFYKTFKSYTHFSQEPIQIPLEGPDLLLMDSPILLKAKIPRQGDLLSDLVLRVSLPSIYSKAFISQDEETGDYILDRAYEFQWVRQIGVRLIDTVTFTVGGHKIQEFTSDWISTRAAMDMDNTQYSKWRYMVGDIPELFDPQNGIYADLSGGIPKYPHVISWSGTTIQNNAPSIPGRILRIPLGLWFSDYIANSLPLVALERSDSEIQIKMRPLRDLYTVLDPSGNRVRPGFKRLPYIPTDQYTSIWRPALYGPLPDTLANLYVSDTDGRVTMRNFLTDIGSEIPNADGWPLEATLEATYTFLSLQERQIFTSKTLRYNIRQVQYFPFFGINTRASHRMDVHNMATRIVYFSRRSDALPYRNQYTNFTNWINTLGSMRPHIVPLTGVPAIVFNGPTQIPIGNSGLNLAGIQRNIIRNAFITANGTPLFDSQDSAYFTEYTPFKYIKGYGMPYADYGLATQSEMWPIFCYSFAIDASSIEQPTGTLNTSMINRLEIDVDVEPIPVGAHYTYELNVYVETVNFLEISSGMGGLKFAM
jgi:hypothetical protein